MFSILCVSLLSPTFSTYPYSTELSDNLKFLEYGLSDAAASAYNIFLSFLTNYAHFYLSFHSQLKQYHLLESFLTHSKQRRSLPSLLALHTVAMRTRDYLFIFLNNI